ncbi:MAG: IS91 family transposase, partial [Desulfobulbaceae bacterium]|nr:IS91 family transposase [Desulfobulbaceae bacterium]
MEFIASITQHIPEPSFQLVRYYGWYSNRMRG